MALSPTTGSLYGMVVAHDPDTIMTYIVPAVHYSKASSHGVAREISPSKISSIYQQARLLNLPLLKRRTRYVLRFKM
jgi:hypothetical protein